MLAALAPAAASCADLPEIQPGACGNQVLEPGEDCDGFAPSGARCRGAGVPGACRFDCAKDANGVRPACPKGWGCGVADSICRAPSGHFAAVEGAIEAEAERVLLGDFDGDGVADVFSTGRTNDMGRSTPRVLFLDTAGRVASALAIRAPLGSGAIANFDEDGAGRADVVFASEGGIVTELGQPDRTLEPVSYSMFPLPLGSKARLVIAQGVASWPWAGAPIMYWTIWGANAITPGGGPEEIKEHLAEPAVGPDQLAGDMVAAQVVEGPGSPCDEVLLAYRDTSSVQMLEPCGADGNWRAVAGPLVPVVELDAGLKVVRAPIVADLDGDGHLDVVAATDSADNPAYVSFGMGDGTFRARPLDAATTRRALPLELVLGQGCSADPKSSRFASPFPLAAGNLNADAYADLVLPWGVVVAHGKQPLSHTANSVLLCGVVQAFKPAGEWTAALVANLNADPWLDVAAASSSGLDIDFFTGAGNGLLNPSTVPTVSPVDRLLAADFDGDLVNDLAIVEISSAAQKKGATRGDVVEVAFGRARGPSETPVRVARFSEVRGLVAASWTGVGTLDTMAVITAADDGVSDGIAVLTASGNRQLLAPYGLSGVQADNMTVIQAEPVAVVVGQFTDDRHPDVVALAVDSSDLPNVLRPRRLWHVPTNGKALFTNARWAELPVEIRLGADPTHFNLSAVLRSGDVDGDGLDEVLLLAPYVSAQKKGTALVVAKPVRDSKGWALQIEAPQVVSQAAFVAARDSDIAVADLDGDGRRDAVLLLSDGLGQRVLLVAWNQAGALDLAGALAITAPSGAPRAFALLGREAGRSPDIAIATDTEVYVARRQPGTRSYSLAKMPGMPGASSIAAGDVSGDGLEDLVVSDGDNVRVFRGEPVLR